ncbi:MAG: hypothetical protein J6Z50_00675, partial [Fibrobacterales bacterium]|nr:hypothetical protein [Fibrobacterales bacterium]
MILRPVSAALLCACAFCLCGTAFAGDGQKAYAQGDFAASAARFSAELAEDSLSAAKRYNLGAALLAERRSAEALALFKSALPSADTALASKIWYDVGNAQYRAGESAADPQAKISAWKEAIAAWRQALSLDEKHEKAKRNVELVQKRLQHEIDKLKQQNQDDQELSEEAKKALKEAYALVREERYAEAQAVLGKALEREPSARKLSEAARRVGQVADIAAGRAPKTEGE